MWNFQPIYKTMCVSRNGSLTDVKARHRLDLRDVDPDDFSRCLKIMRHLPSDAIIPVKVSQFDIKVRSHTRHHTRHHVSTALVQIL
jgi:hypothetical protein